MSGSSPPKIFQIYRSTSPSWYESGTTSATSLPCFADRAEVRLCTCTPPRAPTRGGDHTRAVHVHVHKAGMNRAKRISLSRRRRAQRGPCPEASRFVIVSSSRPVPRVRPTRADAGCAREDGTNGTTHSDREQPGQPLRHRRSDRERALVRSARVARACASARVGQLARRARARALSRNEAGQTDSRPRRGGQRRDPDPESVTLRDCLIVSSLPACVLPTRADARVRARVRQTRRTHSDRTRLRPR